MEIHSSKLWIPKEGKILNNKLSLPKYEGQRCGFKLLRVERNCILGTDIHKDQMFKAFID